MTCQFNHDCLPLISRPYYYIDRKVKKKPDINFHTKIVSHSCEVLSDVGTVCFLQPRLLLILQTDQSRCMNRHNHSLFSFYYYFIFYYHYIFIYIFLIRYLCNVLYYDVCVMYSISVVFGIVVFTLLFSPALASA